MIVVISRTATSKHTSILHSVCIVLMFHLNTKIRNILFDSTAILFDSTAMSTDMLYYFRSLSLSLSLFVYPSFTLIAKCIWLWDCEFINKIYFYSNLNSNIPFSAWKWKETYSSSTFTVRSLHVSRIVSQQFQR